MHSFKGNAVNFKLKVSGQTIYCLFNYNKNSNCLLVLCFPSINFCLDVSKKSLKNFVDIIDFMYCSLYNAFSDPKNKSMVDYITRRFFWSAQIYTALDLKTLFTLEYKQ